MIPDEPGYREFDNMTAVLANRLKSTKPSMILGLVQKSRKLKAEGAPIIDLGIGEPDFLTSDHVKDAAIAAIQANDTKYTVVPGTVALREAIVAKFKRENNLDYNLDEVSVSGGAKQSIYNALMATLSAGDEVIIPAPYWSSYPDMVRVSDGTPVIVDCPQSQDFLISPAQLEAAITPQTKWLMLNSPSNPTGGVYSAERLCALAAVLKRHPHVLVLSDDIYEHLMFDGNQFSSILNIAPDLRDRTVIVNGVSKVFAMTGWRIGYAAGPAHLIKAMNTVQGQCTTHACSISQAAAVAALNGPTDFIAERASKFQSRRDTVVEALNSVTGLSCLNPEGAFYVYPNCAGLIGKRTPDGSLLATDVDVCTWLLVVHHVSCVPGAAFGLSPQFRVSTAASEDDLDVACKRIIAACKTLTD